MSKLKSNANMIEIINIMSSGNDIAAEVVLHLLLDHQIDGFSYIVYLDSKDIRGERLAKLYNSCCNHNFLKFLTTLELLKNNVFLYEEIMENIDSNNPIPFIDDGVELSSLDIETQALEIRKAYLIRLKNYYYLKITASEIKKSYDDKPKHL